jgi:hypothetical protein
MFGAIYFGPGFFLPASPAIRPPVSAIPVELGPYTAVPVEVVYTAEVL